MIPITIQIIKKSAVKTNKLSTAISHFREAHSLEYCPKPQSSYFGRILELAFIMLFLIIQQAPI